MSSVCSLETSMRIRLKHGLPLTPEMQTLAARSKRDVVRRWLAKHPDVQLQQAVYALQLLYQSDHLDLLFDMAERARHGNRH